MADGSKKQHVDQVSINRMFVDRIRHEQQAAQEYSIKWGNEDDPNIISADDLANTVIPSVMHGYLAKQALDKSHDAEDVQLQPKLINEMIRMSGF